MIAWRRGADSAACHAGPPLPCAPISALCTAPCSRPLFRSRPWRRATFGGAARWAPAAGARPVRHALFRRGRCSPSLSVNPRHLSGSAAPPGPCSRSAPGRGPGLGPRPRPLQFPRRPRKLGFCIAGKSPRGVDRSITYEARPAGTSQCPASAVRKFDRWDPRPVCAEHRGLGPRIESPLQSYSVLATCPEDIDTLEVVAALIADCVLTHASGLSPSSTSWLTLARSTARTWAPPSWSARGWFWQCWRTSGSSLLTASLLRSPAPRLAQRAARGRPLWTRANCRGNVPLSQWLHALRPFSTLPDFVPAPRHPPARAQHEAGPGCAWHDARPSSSGRGCSPASVPRALCLSAAPDVRPPP